MESSRSQRAVDCMRAPSLCFTRWTHWAGCGDGFRIRQWKSFQDPDLPSSPAPREHSADRNRTCTDDPVRKLFTLTSGWFQEPTGLQRLPLMLFASVCPRLQPQLKHEHLLIDGTRQETFQLGNLISSIWLKPSHAPSASLHVRPLVV